MILSKHLKSLSESAFEFEPGQSTTPIVIVPGELSGSRLDAHQTDSVLGWYRSQAKPSPKKRRDSSSESEVLSAREVIDKCVQMISDRSSSVLQLQQVLGCCSDVVSGSASIDTAHSNADDIFFDFSPYSGMLSDLEDGESIAIAIGDEVVNFVYRYHGAGSLTASFISADARGNEVAPAFLTIYPPQEPSANYPYYSPDHEVAMLHPALMCTATGTRLSIDKLLSSVTKVAQLDAFMVSVGGSLAQGSIDISALLTSAREACALSWANSSDIQEFITTFTLYAKTGNINAIAEVFKHYILTSVPSDVADGEYVEWVPSSIFIQTVPTAILSGLADLAVSVASLALSFVAPVVGVIAYGIFSAVSLVFNQLQEAKTNPVVHDSFTDYSLDYPMLNVVKREQLRRCLITSIIFRDIDPDAYAMVRCKTPGIIWYCGHTSQDEWQIAGYLDLSHSSLIGVSPAALTRGIVPTVSEVSLVPIGSNEVASLPAEFTQKVMANSDCLVRLDFNGSRVAIPDHTTGTSYPSYFPGDGTPYNPDMAKRILNALLLAYLTPIALVRWFDRNYPAAAYSRLYIGTTKDWPSGWNTNLDGSYDPAVGEYRYSDIIGLAANLLNHVESVNAVTLEQTIARLLNCSLARDMLGEYSLSYLYFATIRADDSHIDESGTPSIFYITTPMCITGANGSDARYSGGLLSLYSWTSVFPNSIAYDNGPTTLLPAPYITPAEMTKFSYFATLANATMLTIGTVALTAVGVIKCLQWRNKFVSARYAKQQSAIMRYNDDPSQDNLNAVAASTAAYNRASAITGYSAVVGLDNNSNKSNQSSNDLKDVLAAITGKPYGLSLDGVSNTLEDILDQ